MNKKIVFLICFLYCFIIIKAEETVSLTGRITDSDNKPLKSVIVRALNTGCLSDINGYYKLNNLPKDKEFTAVFSYLGYEKEKRKLVLNNSENLDITLKLSSIEKEEIVVTSFFKGTQHDNAAKIEYVDLKKDNPLPTLNMMDKISHIPGINTLSKGSGIVKPIIRGLDKDNVVTLNNGIRVENYQFSDHHPIGIMESGIDEVEIIKGPASLLFGSDAIGGVINFLHNNYFDNLGFKINSNNIYFSNSLGIANDLILKYSDNHIYFYTGLNQSNHSDYLQAGENFVPNTRFNTLGIKSGVGSRMNNFMIEAAYEYSIQKYGLTEDEAVELIEKRNRHLDEYYQKFKNDLLNLKMKYFAQNMTWEVKVDGQSSNLTHYGLENEEELNMKLSTLNLEINNQMYLNHNIENIIGVKISGQLNENLNNAPEILLPDATINTYSLFNLTNYKFDDNLNMQAGLRYDYRTISTKTVGDSTSEYIRNKIERNFSNFSGSLGFVYDINDDLLIRINESAAFRNPNLAELTSNGVHELRFERGDSNLLTQKALESDLSLHYHIDNLTFDLAGFYNKINDFIYLSPTNDTITSGERIYQYRQDNSYFYGFEIGAHYHPENFKWFHIMLSYSNVIAKMGNGNYLPFIPADKINLEFNLTSKEEKYISQYFKNMNCRVNLNYCFPQKNTALDEESSQEYFLADISIGRSFIFDDFNIDLNLSCTNILDTKYIDHLSLLKEFKYYNMGRNIILNLKLGV